MWNRENWQRWWDLKKRDPPSLISKPFHRLGEGGKFWDVARSVLLSATISPGAAPMLLSGPHSQQSCDSGTVPEDLQDTRWTSNIHTKHSRQRHGWYYEIIKERKKAVWIGLRAPSYWATTTMHPRLPQFNPLYLLHTPCEQVVLNASVANSVWSCFTFVLFTPH